MTIETTLRNLANEPATPGFQATTTHPATIYQGSPGESPARQYRRGVRFLEGGMPARARQLIDAAMARGHENSEVWFHWLLALVSGRTVRQCSDEELAKLRAARAWLPRHAADPWAAGVLVISRLLATPDFDIRPVIEAFDGLAAVQRDKIIRHLELFGMLDRVRERQLGGDREHRVWKFFHPVPAPPRVRQPVPPDITLAARLRATATAAGSAAAIGYVGWLLPGRGLVSALAMCLLTIGGAYSSAVFGAQWRHRVERRRAKDRVYANPEPRRTPIQPPFGNEVDRLFARYYLKDVPAGTDRATWLDGTRGFRRSDRDELVEAYRESGIPADRLAWLVRFRVSQVRAAWENGTLFAYRDRLRTPPETKLACVLGFAALVAGGLWAAGGAVPAEPVRATPALFVAVGLGWASAVSWLHMALERRRYQDDSAESRERLAGALAAYEWWQRRLADRPSDPEMAAWLGFDRKMLMDEAMRHYRLAPSDVLAHAFLDAPAPRCRRARLTNGPWRFTRYRLVVFLLTADGIRQMAADLRFDAGTFHDRQRMNYRFDAVAAVRVTERRGHPRAFELRLVSGAAVHLSVTGPSAAELDATGLANTLHVLEGIAAEGKDWIEHEGRRRTDFASVAGGPRHDA